MIKVKNSTTNKLSQQLYKKHPFLETQKKNFENIFEIWLCDSYAIDQSTAYLLNLVVKKSNSDDIEKILQTNLVDHDSEKKLYIQKYKIFHKHKLSDFAIIKFAADFYDKTIEELANDASYIYNFSSSAPINKIKNQNLKNQIKHLVGCDILLVLGILFFYLKIATIIENIWKSTIKIFNLEIIKIISDGKSFDYGDMEMGTLTICSNYIERKPGTNLENYINFVTDKLKLIYDIYYQPVEHIKSLDKNNLKKYIGQFPESSIVINDKNKINKKCIMDKYFFLIPIFYQFHSMIEPITESDTKHFIRPNIFHVNKNKLIIEI